MSRTLRTDVGSLSAALALTALAACLTASVSAAPRDKQAVAAPVFTVDGKVALNSFVSLCDGHLRKLADSLKLVASSPAGRSEAWEEIKAPLAEVAKSSTPALLWYAQPDGIYFSLEQGRIAETLTSRAYFPKVLAGQTVIGDLVVSRSTGKSVGIVAVPVFREDKSVGGVLGASVYLDRLGATVRQEMGVDDSVIFYTFDRSPLLGLVWDPSLIFVNPLQLGEPVANAFREMLAKDQGTVSYTFRNVRRTVLFRKSALTSWWYAFGKLQRT